MAKPIHSMIRVLDEGRAVTFYRAAMGLEIVDRYPFDSFTLIYMRDPASTFEVELTVNHDRTEPYNLGDGYGHIPAPPNAKAYVTLPPYWMAKRGLAPTGTLEPTKGGASPL